MRIYLDTCCIGRPFDDHALDRNRLEAEAVLTILRRIAGGDWTMVASDSLDAEVSLIPDEDQKRSAEAFLGLSEEWVPIGNNERGRGRELMALGFKYDDALHVACAESAKCDVLLTTDGRMLKKARQYRSLIKVRIENPLEWLRERLRHGDEGNDTE